MNRAFIVGRITKDLELRTTANGIVTTSFSVAVNRPFTNQNGERQADFINVVVYRKQAENVVKFCSKGSLVGVEGRIQTRNYDAQDGSKRYVTEVVADNVTFLGSKGSANPDFVPNDNGSNIGANIPEIETTNVTDDPFKDFGEEVILNDDDLPF